MISVCVPVYNFNVDKLVDELSKQGNDSGVPFEIVVIDDCSEKEFRRLNEKICSKHKYILLDRNIGRSRIRNLFPSCTKYENLLFIDCDSKIISDDFLKYYLNEIQNNSLMVICGGTVYEQNKPPPEMRLRWIYGRKRESLPASLRTKSPVRYFKTNNFLIKRKIFESIGFDERLTEYGYEDTLFAYNLMKNGIGVKHIDNPVLHACVEPNSTFLEKTEKSIANLISILHYTGYDIDFVNSVKILRVYEKINKLYLGGIVGFILTRLKPVFKFFLSRRFASLCFFDLYKLGVLYLIKKKIKPPKMIPGVGG